MQKLAPFNSLIFSSRPGSFVVFVLCPLYVLSRRFEVVFGVGRFTSRWRDYPWVYLARITSKFSFRIHVICFPFPYCRIFANVVVLRFLICSVWVVMAPSSLGLRHLKWDRSSKVSSRPSCMCTFIKIFRKKYAPWCSYQWSSVVSYSQPHCSSQSKHDDPRPKVQHDIGEPRFRPLSAICLLGWQESS